MGQQPQWVLLLLPQESLRWQQLRLHQPKPELSNSGLMKEGQLRTKLLLRQYLLIMKKGPKPELSNSGLMKEGQLRTKLLLRQYLLFMRKGQLRAGLKLRL
jgi:hypothetical protein